MSMPARARGLLRTTPTLAPVPRRAILSVFGSQASDFLQGLLTTSVASPERGPFYSAVLNAQGRVLHDIFVYTQKDDSGQRGFLIEHDAHSTNIPPLLTVLKRFVLRSKVRIRDVTSEYDVWAAWGSEDMKQWDTERRWMWGKSGAVEPTWDSSDKPWGTCDLALRDRRAVGMGNRLLVRKGDLPQESKSFDTTTADAYTLHRMLHGVPEGVLEIPYSTAFPMDSNLDVMGGIDFRKGCYVGQELTVRTYHTGVVRKRILPVMIESSGKDSLFSINDAQQEGLHDIRPVPKSSAKTRMRGTGKLLNLVNGVGLALLRLEHVQSVEDGHYDFELGLPADSCKITHWWPDWWPRQPINGAEK